VVWQFWGRAAKDVLSLSAQGVFLLLFDSACQEDFLSLVCGRRGDTLGPKNGIHRFHDLLHRAIDVERETDEVHVSKRRIDGNQALPCRITAEIDPHDLVIAVAEVTHPAQ